MTSPQDYRLIPLTHGQFAKVDAADYEWLNQWKWHAARHPPTNAFYAERRDSKRSGTGKLIKMHRLILGLQFGDDKIADHVNLDTLDNRRPNLRLASKSTNGFNRGKQTNNTSGYKGVAWHKQTGKWRAFIVVMGKQKSLGLYGQIEDAHRAYCEAAVKYHGEFARI